MRKIQITAYLTLCAAVYCGQISLTHALGGEAAQESSIDSGYYKNAMQTIETEIKTMEADTQQNIAEVNLNIAEVAAEPVMNADISPYASIDPNKIANSIVVGVNSLKAEQEEFSRRIDVNNADITTNANDLQNADNINTGILDIDRIKNESITVNPIVVKYLNRLSDYLFVLSRHVLLQNNVKEQPWIPSKK